MHQYMQCIKHMQYSNTNNVSIHGIHQNMQYNNTCNTWKYVNTCNACNTSIHYVSGIGAGVKVVDSHLCGWGSIPGESCRILTIFVSKSLSLYFMCSDQHVKYPMPCGFPLTSSFLLDYHVKHYTQTHAIRQLHPYLNSMCILRAC